MAQEIERKFLVKGDFKTHATSSERIIQGYLSSVPERNVRVRTKGDKAYITVKGIGDESGMTRFEWEKEIPVRDAKDLLKICEPGIIDKTRFFVPERSGLVFEVDEFYGDNDGLVVAEIELPEEGHKFEKPEWLGEEVTGRVEYYNASLMKNPYNTWDNKH
jgi:adenylate cyclase